MKTTDFLQVLSCDFFVGVPDSQLGSFCDELYLRYGVGNQHYIAHNEGGAVALAAGYHLATGKIPCVYLQNSGIGNIINPLASLTSTDVYGIPTIFVVGWRGEPGVHDEPQHLYQGKVTITLLEDMDISTFILTRETSGDELKEGMNQFRTLLAQGKSVAFVVKKGALEVSEKASYTNQYTLRREDGIEAIVSRNPQDLFVSTTGKTSRELFEIREKLNQGHQQDFLTVGSMGHCSMIALGIAQQNLHQRIWCLDGDGASLMHLGSWVMVGQAVPKNYIHVLFNNQAHESVGGMPTSGFSVDYPALARACGYKTTLSVDSKCALVSALQQLNESPCPALLEVKVAIGSRPDLGRPTTTPLKNKEDFMKFIQGSNS